MKKLRINGERANLPTNYEEKMDEIRIFIENSGVSLENIYNCDETSLFYRSFPNYTMAIKDDTGAGTKVDKSRVTLLLLTNANGSQRKIYLIVKSKNPRGLTEDLLRENNIEYFTMQHLG